MSRRKRSAKAERTRHKKIRYAIFRTFEKAALRLESGIANETLSKPEDCHDYCSGLDEWYKRRGGD